MSSSYTNVAEITEHMPFHFENYMVTQFGMGFLHSEQICMGAGSVKSQFIINLLVYEQPVWLYVALSISRVIAA